MRSDFRQRLANLIHMAGSSSGLRTSVRTCRILCQTSTSGWHPWSLGYIKQSDKHKHRAVSKPLDPCLPDSLLALWLVGELFVGDDLLQLGEHLSPNHHTKARLEVLKIVVQVRQAHLYDRP